VIVFKKVKKTENNRSLHQSNQCTVIQSYLCCHPQWWRFLSTAVWL